MPSDSNNWKNLLKKKKKKHNVSDARRKIFQDMACLQVPTSLDVAWDWW